MTDGLAAPDALAWAELERRGSVRPRYLKDLKEEIAAELARCLDPFLHEHTMRPYGAVVCRQEPHLQHLGRVLNAEGLSPEAMRSLADGRHVLMLIVKGQPPRLLQLHEPADIDQDYASRAVWVDGLIVCSDESGVARIVTDSSITVIEGRRWTAKDLVFEAAEDIVQVVPVANTEIVRRLLEICHHRISPSKIGATLIYLLNDREEAGVGRDRGVRLDPVGLSVLREVDEPLLLHQVRYRDGAMVIGPNGQLLAVNVMLHPSRASEGAVPATGGTRHTSSARHTHDCPDVLAFVVSADGPVTVFSDGRRIADLKMGDPQSPPFGATSRVELDDGACRHCGVTLSIRTIAVAGHETRWELRCPACDRPTLETSCWQAEVFVCKTAKTIEALHALRVRT